MGTLDSLKLALKNKAETPGTTTSGKQSLSNSQYSTGFEVLMQSSEWLTYKDFIVPQLSQLLATVLKSRTHVSILEVGPGPRSFQIQDVDEDKVIRQEWREVCRELGSREDGHPEVLLFSSPNVMAAFTRHATAFPELISQVSLMDEIETVKSREARLRVPASILKPTKISDIQQGVRWAVKQRTGLAIIGGGHSGHCLWPNVAAVNMSAFDQVHVITDGTERKDYGFEVVSLVVAEVGCKTGDIIRKTMEAGVTIPLGSRPSVGAGLWLQGGIGHTARLHGLACDAAVGAVIVSVESCALAKYRKDVLRLVPSPA